MVMVMVMMMVVVAGHEKVVSRVRHVVVQQLRQGGENSLLVEFFHWLVRTQLEVYYGEG